jgi:dihydroorotate dehydrogenase (fumarate)
MELETTYLNLQLRSPLVVSALPLSRRLDNIKRMEDAGAGAVVLFSLFEEQVDLESQVNRYLANNPKASPADTEAVFPDQKQFEGRTEDYLAHIQKAKESVDIPIIASINCKHQWRIVETAQKIEAAGADALELNVYNIPANMDRTSEQIEDKYVNTLQALKRSIGIPIAVKLVPYFTNLASMARRLDQAGADALVMFNRFYQPDLDPVTLKMRSEVTAGSSHDSRLALHWIAILSGHVRADLAATSGIYEAEDVVKMLMVGADVVMPASVLLREGIEYLETLTQDVTTWLDKNDYASLKSLKGILRQFHSRDVSDFERKEYIRAIRGDQNETS